MTTPRPAPEAPGAGLDASDRAGSDTSYVLVTPRTAVPGPAERLTLRTAIERFLFHCRYEKNLSSKTLRAYEMDLGQFAGFVEPARLNDVGSIGKEEIRTYLAALATRYATKSIKRKVASTKAMFRYLEFEEIVSVSPYRKVIVRLREPARLPRILDLASIHAMFRWAYGRMAAGKTPCLAARDVAVLELLFATGARVAEICQLRVGDLDLHNGTVRLLGKGRRERLIQIVDDEVRSALREYLEIRRSPRATDYLFENQRSGRLSEESVRSLLKRCGREAGLPSPITPHMIRHTVATLLLDEGVDIRQIQILLGHRSIRTTELYTHLSSEAQRRLLTRKHPRRHFRLRESP